MEWNKDRNDHIRAQLEPRIAGKSMPLFISAIVSIAISLKRIADRG